MFIIVSWLDYSSVHIILSDDGKVRLFETHAQAERFAEMELTASWKIVEI